MNNKRGISLIVLVITIVVVVVLATAIILSISESNPIDSSRVAKTATNYDGIRTDLQLYVSNAKTETKAYFTTEEILLGTGSVREGIDFSDNEKVGKNEDGTSNAIGYKLVKNPLTVSLNDRAVTVYEIDKDKYKAVVNNIPETSSASADWYIDLELNVYLVYDKVDDIPKWLRGKAKGINITDDATLLTFLAVKSFGEVSESEPVLANYIALNPKKYYGATINNYKANGIESWQLFHSDGKNVYLISSDFLPSEKVPATKNGTALDVGSDSKYPRGVALNPVGSDPNYKSGAVSIAAGNPARKWLSYLEKYPKSDIGSVQAAAYLLDTSVWNIYKDPNYAEYAIGAPTLELFVDSYNKYHKEGKTIDTIINRLNGYKIKWSTENEYIHYLDGLDVSGAWCNSAASSTADGMWLASPWDVNQFSPMYVSSGGLVGGNGWKIHNMGLRPVVCLSSSVKFVKDGSNVTLQ